MDIPVYLIAGFLDAGKTDFINGILKDGFAAEDRTLLICCEEGEEEYEKNALDNVTVITIEDEEGNEFELEQLATMEFNGREYSAFLPADMSEDDPDYGYIILRIEEENGEELFCSVDDEEELVAVYDKFMEELFGDETDEEEGE